MYGLNAVRVMLTSTSSAIATSRRRITSTVTGSSAGLASTRTAASVAAVNVDLLELADREGVARPDQRARPVLLDQRRPAAVEADRQSVAGENGGVEEAVLVEEEDRPFARFRRLRVAVAVGEPRQLGPRHVQGGERMQHHELRLGDRVGVAVAPLVLAVEFLPQGSRVAAGRQRDLE